MEVAAGGSAVDTAADGEEAEEEEGWIVEDRFGVRSFAPLLPRESRKRCRGEVAYGMSRKRTTSCEMGIRRGWKLLAKGGGEGGDSRAQSSPLHC